MTIKKANDTATVTEIIALAKTRYAAGLSYMDENHTEARNDLRMLAGKDHWDP